MALSAFLLPCLAFSQPQHWKYYGPEEGMGMAFTRIIQDHYGFIWCASSNGLYRYDGHQFKAFKKYVAHSDSIRSDYIWDILEDGQHNIWLATYDGGISQWVRKTGKFRHYRHEPGKPNSLASNRVLRMMMDSRGFLWLVVELAGGVPTLDRLDPSTGDVQHFRNEPGNDCSLDSDTLSAIAIAGSPLQAMIEDRRGQLWVATKQGLNLFVPEEDGFQPVPGPWGSRGEQVIHLYESPAEPGLIWILAGTAKLDRGSVYRLDSECHAVTPLEVPTARCLSYAPTGILHLPEYPEELWLSSRELCRINLQDGTLEPYLPALKAGPSLWQGLRDSLFCLYPGPAGQPWLLPLGYPPAGFTRGSERYHIRDGLYRLDPAAGRLVLASDNPVRKGRSFGMAYSVGKGQQGDFWIGCFPGIYQFRQEGPGRQLTPVFQDIRLWETGEDPDNLSAWDAVERPEGILWVATFKGGLKRVDLHAGAVKHFRHNSRNPASVADDNVFSLFADESGGRLWIGTEKGLDWVALNELDPANPNPVFHHYQPEELRGLSVTAIRRGPDGLLWVGTLQQGLFLFDPANERIIKQFQEGAEGSGMLNSPYINTVFTDSKGRSWVATGMGGLCRAIAQKGNGHNYDFDCHLEGMYIVDIFENTDGKLWLAAMNYGIAIFDPETGGHELWNMENRLSRNSVLGIERDRAGKIWFSSLGLTRYDPELASLKSFRRDAGIQDEDPGRLLLSLEGGRMAYSSINGWLQVFNPDEVQANATPPLVAITGLLAYDPEKKDMAPVQLEENIEVAATIRLGFRQQPFRFSYAGLEFTDPEGIRYASKLDGYETQWNYSRERESNRYFKVPADTYTFLLKAANSDGVWMEEPARLQLIISPSWWSSRLAWLLYFLGLVAISLAIWDTLRRRWHLQAQVAFKHREAARLKELDALKTKFFTDIAHELRTPLAVIDGMAGQVREDPERWMEKGLEMIRRNTRQLLRLANQMLELNRVESGLVAVNMVQGDIMAFLRASLEPFATLALQKGIQLQAELQPGKLEMDFEPEKLQTILSNLLSNALKFTPRGGWIGVTAQAEEAHFSIRVEDTGPGIAEEDLLRAFERGFRGTGPLPGSSEGEESCSDALPNGEEELTSCFELGQGGAGIGLALARELASLLGGTIEAAKRDGGGASFLVLLPISNKAARETPADPPETEAPGPTPFKPVQKGKAAKPKLLIVEDHADIATYLDACLSGDYELAFASNGKEGLETAARNVPDIIVSDIMMPEMDGLELCRRLKNNPASSHIPILMLTARAETRSRIRGYETGADAYLAKPFDKNELLAQIRQLLENRKRLQQYYQEIAVQGPLPPKASGKADKEQLFLSQAREAVLKKFPDPEFGADGLHRALGMSRTQLYNKLRALTGLPTALFIRSIRLQQARLALEQNPGLSVKDAAYGSGFKDPNYFSRCFKAQFGKNPRDIGD